MLLQEMSRLPTFAACVQNTKTEGANRLKRLCPLNSSILLDVLSEIVVDSKEDQPVTTSKVDKYLSMPIIEFKTGDPY